MTLIEMGAAAKTAAAVLRTASTAQKNAALEAVAARLIADTAIILDANADDLARARENGMRESLIDRLTLTADRLAAMADGVRQVAALADPVGEIMDGYCRPN